ncbi:LACT-domain-containing protein [Suhomyces tanzawaensis NRRL Y-17324]|uniref:LACT-domain-containing protein n=1 Tax=Suhomyces tanzawaensis NRRL Y-17324 TaxID=984487 RepID=A0A1E4SMJ8_9ASCO|nr:LACT-domain-containing protein [Suhomyces tanzawaensis NRRL Y-17324]ODV80754.1 LACT-domain-containing protein [Suhomyces tanzawaensis NRRL Y-17324]
MPRKKSAASGSPASDTAVTLALSRNELIESVAELVVAQNESDSAGSTTTSSTTLVSKRLHESRRVVFVLGTLLGLLVTAVFTTYNSPHLKNELDKYVRLDSMSLFEDWRDWTDMLPSGLQLMMSDFDFSSQQDPLSGSAESFLVGKRMALVHNLTAQHSVVMVPGVISTGIESWGVSLDGECPSINHFRKRLWGSFYMLRTMVLDKGCWLKHIMLDPNTGLDPPNVRLRAAQGFEAADFFMAGYWIWNKILQNLAVIGYGPNNMISAAYDWRLAYLDLERRDGYFSKLQQQIELTRRLTGQKTILVGHSMGSQVIFYFLKWVEAQGEFYGNAGPGWCNHHIEAFVDISGLSLGTPKAIPALISGEMKDTVQLNALAVYGLEKFFSRRERVDMLRSFGGIASMFPKGGELIWGNLTHAPDDPTNTLETNGLVVVTTGPKNESFGTFIRHVSKNSLVEHYTVQQSLDNLLDDAPEWYAQRVRDQYSYGVAENAAQLKKNNHDHLKWSNPLEAALPNAPDMKVFCFYGVGKPTERAYSYADADDATKLKMVIDSELDNPVFLGDGDGTVSLLTHTMCHEWKKGLASRFNPGNSSVTIVEIKDEPDRFDIRGGAKTADHVDILGSAELNELVLKVAAGKGHLIEDRYMSNLREIVAGMNI